MLIPLQLQKIELSLGYTAVYLASKSKLFVIYLQAQSGKHIQQWMAGVPSERPLGVDLVQSLMTGCNLEPMQVLIEDENQGVFYTKIFMKRIHEGLTEILEIDARPSESLALAILHKLPIYASQHLIEKINSLNEISS